MKRLEILPAYRLQSTLTEAAQDLTAIKSAQLTSGQSGILGFVTDSGGAYDVSGSIGTMGDTSNTTTNCTVTWTGDGSQDVAFGNVSYAVYANDTNNFTTATQLTPKYRTYTDGTVSVTISYSGVAVSHHTYVASFTLTSYKLIYYWIKGHMVATCPGSIAISA